MLLFAGCNDDHIPPRYDQQCKYAESRYGKYARDGVCVARGVYIAKCKYIEYAKDGMYVTEGKYGEHTNEDASVKEGHNEPLAKEGEDKPLAKDGNWAGYNDEPLAIRVIGHVRHARQ
jgi:hypothetical protein